MAYPGGPPYGFSAPGMNSGIPNQPMGYPQPTPMFMQGYPMQPGPMRGYPTPTMQPQVKKRAENLKVLRMQTYAAEIECSEPETRHWMHRWCVEKNDGNLALMPPMLLGTGLQPTVSNVFKIAAQKYGSNKCMGVRRITMQHIEGKKQYWQKGAYAWRTYEQIYSDVEAAAKGLFQLAGIGEKRLQSKQVVAAIMAETSQEWMISAQAALACGLTLTTVYATLGHAAMMHGLLETKAEVIFLDWSLYMDVKDSVLAKCPALRHIVFIGKDLIPEASQSPGHSPFPAMAASLPNIGAARCTTLDSVILKGRPGSASKLVDLSAVAPTSQDIAMIMYTSGSTGMPKGVVLTHQNFVSVIASTIAQGTITPQPTEVSVSVLFSVSVSISVLVSVSVSVSISVSVSFSISVSVSVSVSVSISVSFCLSLSPSFSFIVCVCVCACVRACMRACVPACVYN